MLKKPCTALALIVFLIGWSGAAPAATVLGYTASGEVALDGTTVPTGTTLISPSVLTTGATQGVIQLTGGNAVLIAQNSTALLERNGDDIRLSMEAGEATLRGDSGEIVTVAQNATMILAAQEPGEGDPVEQEEGQEEGEEEDDDDEAGVIAAGGAAGAAAAGGGGAAGLSTAAWVGIGIATAGAAVIIVENNDDDTTTVASP